MAVTKQQRRAALIALILTASAGGGYVSKDELIAIGQRYCGPVPKAILELQDGRQLPATPGNIALVNQEGAKSVNVRLEIGKAQGLMAAWCDPDKSQLNDSVETKHMKGVK